MSGTQDYTGWAGWNGRKVFLTGHTGFKGSWAVLVLRYLGAEVHGFALEPPLAGIYRSTGIEAEMASSTIGDLADLGLLKSAIQRAKPDLVIHMAAQPLVRQAYADPIETYRTNVMGTAHVLEAVRCCETVNAAVCITSDKCYENREWAWGYREDEPMGGYDPYSSSKGCAELLISSWRRSFFKGTKIASARAGNVVGGGDWSADRLIPDLIRAARSKEPALIRNPGAIRPWQHVLEAVFGYLTLAERLLVDGSPIYATGWNFGPDVGSEQTVRAVAETLGRYWSDGILWALDEKPAPHEATYLKLDSSHAHNKLAWRPKWNFEETMRITADWYRQEVEGSQMLRFSIDQIKQYLAGDHGGAAISR